MKKVSVECRNISLAYGKNVILKDLNIMIEPGEFFALLGPSGSGKSTLLRLIAGFNRQSHGELLIDGKNVGDQPPWERNIGMVFQSYALWPHMTVWDNVAFGLVERKLPREEIRARTEAALALVGRRSSASVDPMNCRVASSSAWRWRARSSSSRRCSCWTSHCPTWTRSCACRCGVSCWPCNVAWASPRFSSRTTRKRP